MDGVEAPAPAEGATVVLWSGYGEDAGVVSVPRHLDMNGDRLRAKYLAFVYDLGETFIRGRRLVDHFRQRDGFSFWWMNRIAEKSPFKSPRVFACLRLLALEEILVERRVGHVTLQTRDADLATAVSRLCAGIGAEFVGSVLPAPSTGISLRRVYEALPHWLQGLLSLRHIALRWRFRSLRPVAWASGPDALFVCSYLFHLSADAAERGEFHSHQWEGLPAWLRDHRVRTNWVHQFLPDGGRDVPAWVSLLRTFNQDAARHGRHAAFETYLSSATVVAIVTSWLRHLALGWRLRGVGVAFTPKASKAWLWPLLRDDWRNSMGGTAAVTNCMCRVLLDAAVQDLPPQASALYLLEGQGWEAAFVHAWRKHQRGEVIGVPHSSMPFWYLSIYDDPRHYATSSEKSLPDRWAVNGRMAWTALAAAGVPESRLAKVEALRFQYLATPTARRGLPTGRSGPAVRLLLLGDFTRGQTLRMIQCLSGARDLVQRKLEITIKRHPICPLDTADTGGMVCEFTERPLGEILDQFDIAFASNTTSAGLDALLTGLPVIAFLDDAGFNQSPLRGVAHVRFVSRPAELAAAIDALAREHVDTPVEDFFWVDEALPRWARLVSGQTHV